MNQIVNTACWNSSTFTNNSSTILINCTGNMSLQMRVWSNVFILLITQKHSLSLIKWNTVHREKFAQVLFSPNLPSLLASEYKTERILISQIINL